MSWLNKSHVVNALLNVLYNMNEAILTVSVRCILSPSSDYIIYLESIQIEMNGTYSYEKWIESSYSDYNYSSPNKWDHKMYYCNATIHDLRENKFVSDILDSWGSSRTGTRTRTRVRVLKIFEYLAPFYTLKYGHCGVKMRIADLDYVHY